jgi:hypothetical protein
MNGDSGNRRYGSPVSGISTLITLAP